MYTRTLSASHVAAIAALSFSGGTLGLVSGAHAQPCIGSQTWQELPRPAGIGPGFGKTVDISDDGRVAVTYAPASTFSGGGVIFTRSDSGAWTSQTVTFPSGVQVGYACISRDGSTVMFATKDTNVPGAWPTVSTWERPIGAGGPFVQLPGTLDATLFNNGGAFTDPVQSHRMPPVQVDATGRTAVAYHFTPGSGIGSARVFTRTAAGAAWVLRADLPGTDSTTSMSNSANFGVDLSADGSTALLVRTLSGVGLTLDVYTRSPAGVWSPPQALAFPAGFNGARLSPDGSSVLVVALNGAVNSYVRGVGGGGMPTWTLSTAVSLGGSIFGSTVSSTGNGDSAYVGFFVNPAAPTQGSLVPSVMQIGRAFTGWSAAAAPFPGLDLYYQSYSVTSVRASRGGEFIILGAPGSSMNAAGQAAVPANESGRIFVLDTRQVGPVAQPSDRTVPVGGATTLFYAAVVGSPTGAVPIYRWSRNGTPLDDGTSATGTVYAGTNSGTLSISNAQTGDHRAVYTCSITNTCNGLTSRPAVLQVGSGCLADIGVTGGLPGSDGFLNNNDFIIFIDYFFNATGCQ